MTVTVLLTVYNAGRYLQRAIDSVLEQSYGDWELLILDDGSTDPHVDDVLQMAHVVDARIGVATFDPSEEERRESCRYATLINWGVRNTAGEYVTYLCGDDYYMPDRLERMVAELEGGVQVVYGSQILLDADGTQIGERGTQDTLADAYERVDLNSVMHTRTSFEEVDGWPTDPSLWRNADAHMWKRLTDAGYLFHPVEGAPTDAKHYRPDSVDALVIAGKEPWA